MCDRFCQRPQRWRYIVDGTMTIFERPTDPDSLLAAVRHYVAEEVLPNVATWDREDRIPDAAFEALLELGPMGASADVIFMLVRVEGSERPSCIVLPEEGRDTSAWEVEFLDKMGYRGVESAAYEFHGLESRGAEILGGEEMLGRGASQMLDALD